jgi:hypothetical protein
MARILLVAQDSEQQSAVAAAVRAQSNFEVVAVARPDQALREAATGMYDVALIHSRFARDGWLRGLPAYSGRCGHRNGLPVILCSLVPTASRESQTWAGKRRFRFHRAAHRRHRDHGSHQCLACEPRRTRMKSTATTTSLPRRSSSARNSSKRWRASCASSATLFARPSTFFKTVCSCSTPTARC